MDISQQELSTLNQSMYFDVQNNRLLTPDELAKFLCVKVSWLARNRISDRPIPFKKFGKLVRYQLQEVLFWLENQSGSSI